MAGIFAPEGKSGAGDPTKTITVANNATLQFFGRSTVWDKIHVLNGEVAAAVPQLAAELRAQILVLGAISRRGLRRFAIGNTAERIIDESPCDLLIVKPPGFKPRLGRALKQAVTLPKQ